MTEDPRISEIRAVLAEPMLDEAMMLDAVNAILDRPAPAPQPVDWPAVAEAFADEIAALSPPAPSAPRVFFPGDDIPSDLVVVAEHAVIYAYDANEQSWDDIGGPVVEMPVPSPEEWQAAVDRASAEREADRG